MLAKFLCLILFVSLGTGQTVRLSEQLLDDFIGTSAKRINHFPDLRRQIIKNGLDFLYSRMGQNSVNNEEYPYFHWIPPYVTSLIPGAPAIQFESPCFKKTSVSLVPLGPAGFYNVTFELSQRTSLTCSDFYMLATMEQLAFPQFLTGGTHSITWDARNSTDPAQVWDLKNTGDDEAQTWKNILATAELFGPETTMGISDAAYARNLDFMQKYAGVTMTERATFDVPVDESLIQSGDFIGVIRLDGVDPMLAWAMGSTTGHTTIAMRMYGQLYITESTVMDSYWPTDGIQKTPYATWIQQAKSANYSAVWAPLSADARSRFDVGKAQAYFESVEGFEYGYYNMLFGWIDTPHDNYPCLPPTYTQCLQYEHIPIIIGIMEKLAPKVADQFFLQALNHRLNTTGLTGAQIFETIASRGLDPTKVPTIVEDDGWLYNTSRNKVPQPGPSSVCCVFVCKMWKAAGVFTNINDEIQCGEQTNWDDYALTILDSAPIRPTACIEADPSNPLCQLDGKYTLILNNLSSKKPFPNIGENCPSLAPNYTKPPDC